MGSNVEEILRQHYVDGVFHTHVSLLQPKGRFQFGRKDMDILWDIYCSRLQSNDTNKNAVGIAEKAQHYLPLLADVDLKVKDNVLENISMSEHIYTTEQLCQVIQVYQSVLRNTLDGCKDENLMCVVLEKTAYFIGTDENCYIKNGFHLHFPFTFVSKVDQEVHIIPRVQQLLTELNVFEDFEIKDSGSVIDKASCKVPWLLYGSQKSEDMDPYILTKIYDADCEEISLEKAFRDYKIYDQNEEVINIKDNIEFYLPRILSIIPYGREVCELKQGLISPLKDKIKERTIEKTEIKQSATEALDIASKLLPMVSDSRIEDRNDWMTIGWILYNIGEGSPQALDLWIETSRRCEEKFDEGTCLFEWERMVKKNITLGTLRYFASQDSPELYKEYKKESATFYLKESLNGSHNDIAKLLHVEYGNEFVCASISNKVWYQFREHRWEEIEEGIYLRSKISELIVDKYTEMGKELWDKMAKVEDKAEEEMYKSRHKQIQKVVGNLKSAPFKTNIMKEAMEVFYDRQFKNRLDQDPMMIGFKNGVYDLRLNIFREGRPEDYVSKCIPINYEEYNEGSEEVQNVIEFLEKIFPDKSIRTYFLDTYSDIFVGGNTQKKIYLWTGEGDNGKSITQTFFEKMLGELAIKFNTQYFTGKKIATGSANPELARAAPPVRHATMEEPDADEQLNIGELKKLSGGDSYWARDLFEKGKSTREVFPMFSLTFICNKLPKLRYSDKATWNRLRVIPFESTFVEPGEECPSSYEEQLLLKKFPMDKGFAAKIPEMVKAFAWYLLQWRQKVTIRIEPEKVKEATAIYRRQNDIYRQFIEECINDDENSIISITEIYAQFKEWFREGWSGMGVPIKNEVKEYFERLWGETPGSRWKGYRIRTLDDEISAGDVLVLNESDLTNYDEDRKSAPPL